MVIKKYEEIFKKLKPVEPPAELFERIILAIRREQESQKRKKLLFGCLFLLIGSLFPIPFSWTLFLEEIKNSGTLYFISTAVNDFGLFLNLWQDFILAILESLPIVAISVFMVNIAFLLWVLRLFLCRKKLLLSYL